MSARMPSDTATTAAAEPADTRSHQVESWYPPPSCSAFHGRSASSECMVMTCGMPYSMAARWPARLAYQVCEWTSCAPLTPAVMDRSVDMT